ncbi:hypothetical protein D9M71_184860 [compost metagenome]
MSIGQLVSITADDDLYDFTESLMAKSRRDQSYREKTVQGVRIALREFEVANSIATDS